MNDPRLPQSTDAVPDPSAGIDWPALARKVGALSSSGETGGDAVARRALSEVLGAQALCQAVEHYITEAPGSETVRSVLWLLRPPAAADHCHAIWRSDRPLQQRRNAVELVRAMAAPRMLPWVGHYLDDPDPSIQSWGASLLDQLLFQSLVSEEDVAADRERLRTHQNPAVRKTAAWIDEFLGERRQLDAGDG